VAAPTVALVRHASTAWSGRRYAGRSDPPLDAAGVIAAVRLGRDLAGTIGPGDRIVTSPARRARATADAIWRATGASVDLDVGWQEADFGAAEGLTYIEVSGQWPELGRQLAAGETDIDWPDGETAAGFDARVLAAWAALADDPRPTVVVAHAGPLRIALALAAGRRPAEMWLPAPASIVWVPAPGSSGSPVPVDGGPRPDPHATLGR
jgi:broad specificity phosphatase PhoE